MMSPAMLSLLALGAVIIASFSAHLNVGVLAIAVAWPIAMYAADWPLDKLMGTFPSSLFLTLLGVTMFFGVAQVNGTMGALTQRALRLCGGRVALLPALYFLFACLMSTVGPGSIATLALLAPLAMAASARAGVPMLLTALMIGNGANAGNLSPFSAVGIVVSSAMERIGLGGHEWSVWAANFTAHALASVAAWALFGGLRLRNQRTIISFEKPEPLARNQTITLIVGAAWIAAVIFLKVQLGLAAFAAASALILLRAGDDTSMLKAVPLSVIVMVCGVSVLIGVLEGTGGMDLFTTLLARVATADSVNGVMAFVTGSVSTYSSTSGVVYPTFLPAIPGLVEKLGGGSPLQIAFSINVGAALVDVSPLSTLGALCIAALPPGHDPARLFRSLLLWGFAMTIAGAVFCQLFIGYFAR